MTEKRLFIAMPYGIRTDRLDHYNEADLNITLDFDKIWAGVIQQAIPEDYIFKRADELRQPGIIDKLYIEWLFTAEVVIADLTFGNPNVYYELGMRHVFSKKGTVLVAHAGSKLPFDVRNQFILYYNYFEAPSLPKFHKDLRSAIIKAYEQKEDSPVHILLPGLNIHRSFDNKDLVTEIDELKKENNILLEKLNNFKLNIEGERYLEKINAASEKSKLLVYYNIILNKSFDSIILYENLGIKLRKFGLVNEAINIFSVAIEKYGDDAELYREVGFCYRKLGVDHFSQAEEFFLKALLINDKDPELLGMLGGMYKRNGDFLKAKSYYEKASLILKNDIYSLVNLAFLQLLLDSLIKSRITYQKIIEITNEKIISKDVDYWDYLTRGQALLITGDIENCMKSYEEALILNPPIEDLRSEFEQLELIKSKTNEILDIEFIIMKIFIQFR